MININLDNELSQAVEQMAKHQHKPVEQIINDAIMDKLEDYHDIKAAQDAIKNIESGKESVIPWEQVKTGLYDMED